MHRNLTKTLEERFWAKVDKSNGPESCWPWLARSRMKRGYGIFHTGSGTGGTGQQWGAHRVAFWLTHYECLPPRHKQGDSSESVCHSCDNPPCCNPKHLFLGSPKDNAEDCRKKGRQNGSAKRHLGEAHGRAKLTVIDVLAIRESKESGRIAAVRYGVAPSLIWMIRRKEVWRHV